MKYRPTVKYIECRIQNVNNMHVILQRWFSSNLIRTEWFFNPKFEQNDSSIHFSNKMILQVIQFEQNDFSSYPISKCFSPIHQHRLLSFDHEIFKIHNSAHIVIFKNAGLELQQYHLKWWEKSILITTIKNIKGAG